MAETYTSKDVADMLGIGIDATRRLFKKCGFTKPQGGKFWEITEKQLLILFDVQLPRGGTRGRTRIKDPFLCAVSRPLQGAARNGMGIPQDLLCAELGKSMVQMAIAMLVKKDVAFERKGILYWKATSYPYPLEK